MSRFKLVLEVSANTTEAGIRDFVESRLQHAANTGPCIPYTINSSKVEKLPDPHKDIGCGLRVKRNGLSAEIGVGDNFDNSLYLDKSTIEVFAKWAKENL